MTTKCKYEEDQLTFDQEDLDYSSGVDEGSCHPLRLKILGIPLIATKWLNVNKIYNTMKIEQSITSQHLKILKSVGIVDTNKEGKIQTLPPNRDYKQTGQRGKSYQQFFQ